MTTETHLHSDSSFSGPSVAGTRIIQITDPHIFASPEASLNGVNTADTLAQVLSLMRKRYWPPAAVVLTGDLVEKISRAAYQNLRAQLLELDVSVYCLPGNHDDPELMHQVMPGENIYLIDHALFGKWIVIFLSTHSSGNQGGHLDQTALDSLERLLHHPQAKYALVCLHHPVVPIGSPWLDAMRLDNPEELFAVLDRQPKVKGVIWGHIHQEFSLYRRGVALLGTPSTCVQFLPGSDRFAKDPQGPGYRWLTLGTDGRLQSGIVRVPV
ncbi:MAG: phosphodiesterase [Gammaproteobacteria bacterium]